MNELMSVPSTVRWVVPGFRKKTLFKIKSKHLSDPLYCEYGYVSNCMKHKTVIFHFTDVLSLIILVLPRRSFKEPSNRNA